MSLQANEQTSKSESEKEENFHGQKFFGVARARAQCFGCLLKPRPNDDVEAQKQQKWPVGHLLHKLAAVPKRVRRVLQVHWRKSSTNKCEVNELVLCELSFPFFLPCALATELLLSCCCCCWLPSCVLASQPACNNAQLDNSRRPSPRWHITAQTCPRQQAKTTTTTPTSAVLVANTTLNQMDTTRILRAQLLQAPALGSLVRRCVIASPLRNKSAEISLRTRPGKLEYSRAKHEGQVSSRV